MSIFPQKNSWLLPLPDDWSPENYRTLPVCIPDSDEWEAIFYDNLSQLALQHKWARDETGNGAKTVAGRWRETWAFNRVLGGCGQEHEGVIWYETPDDIDGERAGSPTTELLGSVALLGLLALVGPSGIIVYEAVSPIVELWFDDSVAGLLGKLVVNDADEILIPLLGEGGFKKVIVELDNLQSENTLRLENVTPTSALRNGSNDGQEIRVVRRNISIVTDESMYRLRQSPNNPFVMEQSWDGGKTWSTAYNYGNLGGGGGGGGNGRSYTEQKVYNETLIQQFNNNIVNNITINQNTAYDGTANDKYKRQALCMTLETLVRGYHETFKGAPQSATDYYEKTWVTTGLIGAGLSFVAFALPVAPVWVTYVAMGGAFTALAGASIEWLATAGILQAPAIVINELPSEMIDDYLCDVINRINYPVSQTGLGTAFQQAYDNLPATNDEEKYLKSLAFGFAEYMGSREMYSSFINVWGDTALAMQAIDAEYDGCLCWDKYCLDATNLFVATEPNRGVLTPTGWQSQGTWVGGATGYASWIAIRWTLTAPFPTIDSVYLEWDVKNDSSLYEPTQAGIDIRGATLPVLEWETDGLKRYQGWYYNGANINNNVQRINIGLYYRSPSEALGLDYARNFKVFVCGRFATIP